MGKDSSLNSVCTKSFTVVGLLISMEVLLMPEGIDAATLEQRATWLEPLCSERGFTFCPRQHIFWYGNKRAT